MSVIEDQFREKAEFEWGALKSDTYPVGLPVWVEKLTLKVEMWLGDEEEFEYLSFTRNGWEAHESTELTVVGITPNYVLRIFVEKPQASNSKTKITWELAKRERVTDVSFGTLKDQMQVQRTQITVSFEGISEPVVFPTKDDYEIEEPQRLDWFRGLRDAYFEYN